MSLTLEQLREKVKEHSFFNEEQDLHLIRTGRVLALLDQLDTEGWISVEERVPEDHQLVVDAWNGSPHYATHSHGIWWSAITDLALESVSHWRPISSGPKP